jgi:glutaminase
VAGAYISTGDLPPAPQVDAALGEVYEALRPVADGEVSTVYPALASADPALWGLCVVATDGTTYAVGDADIEFSIMSVSKPFVFALVCDALGPAEARDLIGVDATGLAFDSVEAIERAGDGRTNPMVNAGAIATTSAVPGASSDDKWACIVDGLSRFAGRSLTIDDGIYSSASATNFRNRTLTQALESTGRLGTDPAVALDLYTRQCSLRVTARDLAAMGATLADGGVHPVTRERVVSMESCRATLAVMTTAGLYETSGTWLYDVGLPGKSGIGGGIVTVSPGKGALGTFSPPLDAAGNSVRGVRAAALLSRALGLDLFMSSPSDARQRA